MKTALLSFFILFIAFKPYSGNSHPAEYPRRPNDILLRIDQLISQDAVSWCKTKGLSYPPAATLLRVFKREKILELWAKNKDMKQMKKLKVLNICSMDFVPGPKFEVGDGKTPEGFYFPRFLYGSNYYWMWIKLTRGELDRPGCVGKGSSFKMCINYPNILDRLKSKAYIVKTGGEICLHGNCVSAGCISFENKEFLPVFAFSRHHKKSIFGKLQLHIFPFDFNGVKDLQKEAEEYAPGSKFSKEQLYLFWSNLKAGYERFNETRNPVRFEIARIILRKEENSADIPKIKTLLKRKKMFSGNENDPKFDNRLESAVKKFQRQHNLVPDGIVGPKTLRKLNYIFGKYVFPQQPPRFIHVFVVLCDNKHQGIVPVSPILGNGEDPKNNLYWGARFGIKTFFKNSRNWKFILSSENISKNVLERVVFRHKDADVYLVADGYKGRAIKRTVIDFLESVSGNKEETVNIHQADATDIRLKTGGAADLLVYVGHNGLMDFSLGQVPENKNGKGRDAIVLACASKNYFDGPLLKAKANPIMLTTGLMAPEAYALESALAGWIRKESKESIRLRAAISYSKYQGCSVDSAKRLFLY